MTMAPSISTTGGPSPLCRCRVLYIGSSIPTITKDGLQGIQQPLRERYPTDDSPDTKGIDSWLSVWYNGLLLEYVEGDKRTESAFFPINSLHYCAAVRYVNMGEFAAEGGGERFIPLDSSFAAQSPDSPRHPPIFAAIFRRTSGVKVLECHGFVCTNEKAANALVRCCFHAYADTIYLKLDEKMQTTAAAIGGAGGGGGGVALKAIRGEPTSGSATPSSELNLSEQENAGAAGAQTMMLVEAGTMEWNERAISQKAWQRRQQSGEYDATSMASSVAKKGEAAVMANGSGGRLAQRPQGDAMVLVPYGREQNAGFGRRAASQTELRSPVDTFFADTPRRIPPPGMPPFYFGPPLSPSSAFPPFLPPGPSPSMAAFMHSQPLPHFFPPRPHHLFPPPPPFPFHPPPAPPHFGRIANAHFPPFMMRPLFFMPPTFVGPHLPPIIRQKSPERTGSGPIITETVYDTFPRTNRGATYEEPIYMPSSNNAVPPQASYKPGSFSPELYEHYYETYNRQQQHRTSERKVSRSNSETSADFWDNVNASRKSHANERAFGSTLAGENGEKMPPKINGISNERVGTLTRRPDEHKQQSTSKSMATRVSRPETPPADYEPGMEIRDSHRTY